MRSDTSKHRLKVFACRLRSAEQRWFHSPTSSSCSPGKSQDPITRVSSIVMQITITNRRQGRGPLRYRGTRISSSFFSPRLASLSLASTCPFSLDPAASRIQGHSLGIRRLKKEDPGNTRWKRNRDSEPRVNFQV